MKNGLFLAVALLCSGAAMAENRAEIQHLTANLKLPDQSSLTVDMSFDCGSMYDKTAMIVTSRQGAEILAVAYEALYGPAAGAAVMAKWNNKDKPQDPRLPTFIIVTPPEGKVYRAEPVKSAVKSVKGTAETATTMKLQQTEFSASEIRSSCGSSDHPSYQ
jgi:hypothetical protein